MALNDVEHCDFIHAHEELIQSVRKRMPDEDALSDLAELYRVFGDSTRIRIFWLLCHCEECVINISALMDMSSPAVSHHLKLLRAGNLITSRREGKEVYYKAADTEQSHLLHDMIEKIAKISCPGS